MAKLIKCKACGAEISKNAKECPHCGEPVPKSTSLFTWFILIVLIFAFIGNLLPESSNYSSSTTTSTTYTPPIKPVKPIEPTQAEIEKKQKIIEEERTSDILAKLKKLPAKKVNENYNLYKELVEMYPGNAKYTAKMKYYNDKKDLILTCGNEQSMYKYALRKAIAENPIMKRSSVYDYKMFKTGYGYAYTIYFNKSLDARNAHMILVTMDKKCKILATGNIQKSTFYLKSKNNCIDKGTITGDNHDITVKSCGKNFQFQASNDALSRNFSKSEITKIKNIFKTAKKKYKTFSDKQILYKTKDLKIWVRLFSPSKWYLVFDMKSIAPYPSSPEASVWIKSDNFISFTELL